MTDQRIVQTFLGACRDHRGEHPSPELREATGALFREVRADRAVVRQVVEALPTLPAEGAAWTAVTLGSIAESGVGLEISGEPIVDLFLAWVSQLSHEPSGAVSKPSEERVDSNPSPVAFRLLCQSVVAHLARMPERRARLAQDAGLLDRLERLEELSVGAVWAREALLRRSGKLIALHPQGGRGVRLRYVHVATCFQLFSLLQLAVGERLPGGRKPDSDVADAARGSSDGVVDEACWHYGDPRSATPQLGASIWGEANVESIPSVDGVQVVLLWPKVLQSRVWDSSVFGPELEAMPPKVLFEGELSAGECRSWFEKLGVAAGKRKWWQTLF